MNIIKKAVFSIAQSLLSKIGGIAKDMSYGTSSHMFIDKTTIPRYKKKKTSYASILQHKFDQANFAKWKKVNKSGERLNRGSSSKPVYSGTTRSKEFGVRTLVNPYNDKNIAS